MKDRSGGERWVWDTSGAETESEMERHGIRGFPLQTYAASYTLRNIDSISPCRMSCNWKSNWMHSSHIRAFIYRVSLVMIRLGWIFFPIFFQTPRALHLAIFHHSTTHILVVCFKTYIVILIPFPLFLNSLLESTVRRQSHWTGFDYFPSNQNQISTNPLYPIPFIIGFQVQQLIWDAK